MKAILEFQLPEESQEHKIALEGQKYASATESMFNWIRSKQKYRDLTIEEHNLLDELRQFLVSELE